MMTEEYKISNNDFPLMHIWCRPTSVLPAITLHSGYKKLATLQTGSWMSQRCLQYSCAATIAVFSLEFILRKVVIIPLLISSEAFCMASALTRTTSTAVME